MFHRVMRFVGSGTASAAAMLSIVLFATCVPDVRAEGSRSLHPSGAADSNTARGSMALAATTYYPQNVVRARQFLYVYAQAGEHILLGSRNRTANGTGAISLYAPQSFGSKGNESIPGTATFICNGNGTGGNSSGRGLIGTRAAELAGPLAVNGSGGGGRYTPCYYQVTTTGIHGVLFGIGASGAATSSIDTPAASNIVVTAWDVTVRSSTTSSLTDIDGRVFTYAWAVDSGGNNTTAGLTNRAFRIATQLYYVSTDGYRYMQEFRGVDPRQAAFYGNSRGFLDTNGAPLYRDYRGTGIDLAGTTGASHVAGITAQAPEYPIFFSDASPTGPNAVEINRVLTALSIPQAPLAPILTNPVFVGNIGGNMSTVSAGGTFTFDTVNTLTYEIVIKRGATGAGDTPPNCLDNYDPANICNRVLTGTALTGSQAVLWNGRDNNGNPFPAGNYPFRIVGRNGEIHFPIADIEGNVNGGPTLTKLNGTNVGDTTVYFDDRGYQAANGNAVGVLNGTLCPAGITQQYPAPETYNLLGIDSAAFTGSGVNALYYRRWGTVGTGNTNADCVNNNFFGDAKGLDLWALEKSQTYQLPIEIIPPASNVDVGTAVTVTPNVLAGDTAFGTFVFTNAGSDPATGVSYAVTLGNPAIPATCPVAVNFTLLPIGVTATWNPAPACTITFTGMPATLTAGQTLTFNFNYVVAPTNPGPIPITTTISAGNETCNPLVDPCAQNTANAQTVIAKPIISVSKGSTPAPGTTVQVNDVITYALSVTIQNAPLTSQFTLTDALGTGLTFGSVSSASPAFNCSGSLSCTLPIGTATGTYTVTYTATVNNSAVGSVANSVTPSGGGGDNPPTCAPCSIQHPLAALPYAFCPAAGDPALVFSVVNGANIYGYTPGSATPDVLLPLTPATISSDLNALMVDPVRNRLLMIQRSSTTESTLWAYDAANGGWYVAFGPFTSPDFPRGGFNATGTGYLLTGGASPQVWGVVSSSTFGYTVTLIDTMNYDVAPTDAGSGDIAFDGAGKAWLAVGQDLYHLPLSGPLAFTAVRQTRPTLGGSPSTINWAGMAFASDGTLVLANNTPSPSAYYQYDPADGTIVHRVNTTANSSRDLASCAFPMQLAAELSVVKTLDQVNGAAPGGLVYPGDLLRYAITISNTGGAVATLFANDVQETVPLNSTHVAGDSFTCPTPAAGSACANTAAVNVPAGSSVTLYFTVQLDSPLPTAQISNAVAIPGEVDCSAAPNDCTEVTPVGPRLTMAKTLQSGGPAAQPGGSLVYAITLTNLSGVPANVAAGAIGETVPANTTHAGGDSFTCAAATPGSSCSNAAVVVVPANGSTVLTFAVTVDNPIPPGVTAIANTATPPPGVTCPSCTVTTPTAPNVTIAKVLTSESGSQNGVAEPGETLTYTATLTNTGGTAFANYGFVENVPIGATLASVTGGTAACALPLTGAATCAITVANVPAGGSSAVTIVFTVANPIPAGTAAITNLVNGGDIPAGCPSPNLCSVTTPTAPSVTIVKALTSESGTQPGVAEPGETLTYTITLTNSGGTAFTNYDFVENVPNGATLSSVTGAGVTACATPVTGVGTCAVTIASVPASASTTVSVVFTLANPIPAGVTSILNLINGGDIPPGCPSPNVCSVTTPTRAELAISKTADTPMPTGTPNQYAIAYAVTVTNSGGSSGNYDLADTLSFNGATVLGISAPVHASGSGDPQTGVLGSFVAPTGGTIVSGESLAAGGNESWTYTVLYAITDASLAANCGTAGGGLRNRALLGGEASGAPPAETCSGAPNAGIVKTAGAPVPTGVPNQFTLTYQVTVTNTGTLAGEYDLSDSFTFNGATVQAVSVPLYVSTTDTQDGVLGTFTAPNGGVVVAGETILAGGTETWIYSVTYTITNAGLAQDCMAPGGGLRNDALLGGSMSGQSTTCTGAPAITIGKSVSGPAPTGNPGEYTLAYLVTVQNTGSLAGSYDLDDSFSFAGVANVGVSAIVHAGSDPLATVLGTLGPAGGNIVTGETIAAGANETYAYTVTFTVDDVTAVGTCTSGGGLVNLATLGGSSSGQVTTCSDVPNVSLVKSAGPAVATGTPNQYTLAYLVTVSNTGAAVGSYDLDDAFTFAGATIDSVSPVTHSGPDPLSSALGVLTAAGGNIVIAETIGALTSESYSYSVTFTLTDPALAGDCSAPARGLRNRAVLGGTAVGEAETCTGTPNVSLVKALTGESGSQAGVAEPGETLTWTITLTNTGGTAFLDYDFVENVPNGATLSSVTGAGVTACVTPVIGVGTCNVTVASVPANSSTTVTVVFMVANPIPAGTTSIVNLVSGGDTTCAVPGNTCSVTTPTAPNVTLVKALTNESGTQPGVAEPGETLTYTITLTNTGGTAFTNYDFVENVPNGATLSSVTGAGVTACATPVVGVGTCNVTVASVPASGSTTVTVVFTVANPIPAGTTAITNLVSGGDIPPGCPSPNLCSVTTPTAPSVTIVKALTSESGTQPGVAEPGETLTYTITLTNTGGTAFTNYDFVENVPNGATLTGVTGAGVSVSACPLPITGVGACNVTVASVPANDSTTVSVVFTVANPIAAGMTAITNLVSGGDIPPDCPAPNVCTVTTPTAPNVSLVKALTGESGSQAGIAEPGETLTYTITLTNAGGTTFTNYDFVENVPNGATLTGVTGADVSVSACPLPITGAGTCNVTVANVPASGSTTVIVTFVVADPIPGASAILNLVNGGDTTCAQPGNVCSVTTPTAPSVTLVKALTNESGSQTGIAEPGETLTYTITLTNTGGTAFANYDFVENVPTGATLTGVTGAGVSVSACPLPITGAGTCNVTIASVPASGSTTVTVVFTVANPIPAGTTAITNLVNGGDIPPNCPAPNVCSVTTPTAPNVTLVKTLTGESGSLPGIAEPGETLTYTITLDNGGGTTFTDYDFVENVPNGATLTGVTGAGVTACATPVTGVGTCNVTVASVPANGSTTVTVTFVVADPIPAGVTSILNLVNGGDTSCAQPGNDCDVDTPTVGMVTLSKSVTDANGNGIAEAGENLTWTITLTNTGGTAVTGQGVTDPLDVNTTFVSATLPGAHDGTNPGGVVTWSGLTVPAQIGATPGTLVLTLVTAVNTPIADGVTHIGNFVHETGTTPPDCAVAPTPANCASIPTEPKVTVSKALSGESITEDGIAEPGEQLTWTITLRNHGGTPAVNVIVNEWVPLHTTFVSGTPGWTCAAAAPGGTACDAVVTVPAADAGGSPGVVTLTFTAQVVDPIPAGVLQIANVVALDDATPPDCATIPTHPQCVVTPTINLNLVKSVESVTATGPGTYWITYRIDLVNTGGSPATYTLTDTPDFTPNGVTVTGSGQAATTTGTLNPGLPGGQFTVVNGMPVQISAGGVTLPVGATHSYTVRIPIAVSLAALENGACTGDPGNGLYNRAAVSGSFDADSATCAPVSAEQALIRLVKTVRLGVDHNGDTYGNIGDVLHYAFAISNPGSVTLSAIQLVDPRVTDLQCDATTAFGERLRILRGDELFVGVFEELLGGQLVPGDSIACSATYTLTAQDVLNRRVVNSATASGAGSEGQVVTSTSTAIYTNIR